VLTLKWKRLHAHAQVPATQSAGAACFDLRAALDSDLVLKPGEIVAIPTGLAVEIPQGFELQVRARSGMALKHGLSLVNGVGTIDCDYRGEIKVISIVLGREPLTVRSGDRIAQALVSPVPRVEHVEVESLSETERGAGGFGSTGRA
jgi:dUTP pyrophosphatase